MLVLVGPSASGKSEIVKELIHQYSLEKFVTCTTRKPRVGEVNKVDYYFLTVAEFQKLYHENAFIETVFYNGNYYGSLKSEVEDNKVVILEPQGLASFRQQLSNLFVVSLKTEPNLLKKRMLSRGDSMLDTMKRLENDQIYFNDTLIGQTDLVIKTDDKTIAEISKLIYDAYNNYLKKFFGGK